MFVVTAPPLPTPPEKPPWRHLHLNQPEPGVCLIKRTSLRSLGHPPHPAAFISTITIPEQSPASPIIQIHDQLSIWLGTGHNHRIQGNLLLRDRTELVWCLHIPDLIAFVRASEYPIILEEKHEGWITLEIYDDRRE